MAKIIQALAADFKDERERSTVALTFALVALIGTITLILTMP